MSSQSSPSISSNTDGGCSPAGLTALWQWKGDYGWVYYDLSVCQDLETLQQRGIHTCFYSIEGRNYIFDFHAMTQTNQTTGRVRFIRKEMSSVAVWMWEGNPGSYHRYDGFVERFLEQLYETSPSGGRVMIWQQYSIDVDKMLQTNTTTGFSRRVRRMLITPSFSSSSSSSSSSASSSSSSASSSSSSSASSSSSSASSSSSSASSSSSSASSSSSSASSSSSSASSSSFSAPSSSSVSSTSHSSGNGVNQPPAAIHVAGYHHKHNSNQHSLPQNGECSLVDQGVAYCVGNDEGFSSEIAWKYTVKVEASASANDVCPICLDQMEENIVKLSKCDHFFHEDCLKCWIAKGCKNGFECPNCKRLQCTGFGDCPKGTMIWKVWQSGHKYGLDGYPGLPTIHIQYMISSGIQSSRHPNPMMKFTGTSRKTYLPYNREGRKILNLLVKSFKLGHTFTVGTSVASGLQNAVIWNGIHHKTRTNGGPAYFGYPDDTYFERVIEELKAKGIEPFSVDDEEDASGFCRHEDDDKDEDQDDNSSRNKRSRSVTSNDSAKVTKVCNGD